MFIEVGPASMIVGNLVAGKRIAQASGRELAHLEDSDQARKVLGSSWGAEGCVASKTPCRCRVSFLCAVPVPGGCAAVASSHHPRPPTLLVAECQGKCRALEVFPLCHFQVVLIFVRTIESYWVLMPSVAGFSLPVAFLVETCALCS